MKKTIYISFILVLVASCSKQEPLEPTNTNNNLINAIVIDSYVNFKIDADITDPDKDGEYHDNDGITDPDKDEIHDQEDKPKSSSKN